MAFGIRRAFRQLTHRVHQQVRESPVGQLTRSLLENTNTIVDRVEPAVRRAAVDLGARGLPTVLPSLRERMDEALESVRKLGSKVRPEALLSRLNPRDDTIAVFDSFGFGQTHGDKVEEVLQRHTDASDGELRRIPTGATPPAPGTSFEGRVEHRATSMLEFTSLAIAGVVSAPGRIKVINQSQSISPVRVADELWSEASTPEKKGELAEELGLPEDAEDDEILQRLVDSVQGVFRDSAAIARAKARYEERSAELESKGILHVVTAGNTGDFLDDLDRRGVRYGREFSHSVLFNDDKIVVAASTGGRREEIADFSTPSRYVTLAIDGTGIHIPGDGNRNGTSYAAPQVTAVIAEVRRINSALTNDEVRALLAEASQNTAAPTREEGQGILDPDRAVALARESLRPATTRCEIPG